MAIKKCEKCELNYVQEEEQFCKVCKNTLDGKKAEMKKVELCPSCGERIVAKGYELCKVCIADMLDTVETLEDENGDVLDQGLIPADMEITEINLAEEAEEEENDEENDVPDDVKSELVEDDYEASYVEEDDE